MLAQAAKIKIYCFLWYSMLLYNKELDSVFFPKYLFKIKIIFDQDEKKFCS